MRLSLPSTFAFAAVCGIAVIWYANYVPDLSKEKAAELISRAPEFNRYARLIQVEGIAHGKGSMHSMSYGSFTFRYLNSPSDAPPIHAEWVDFQYWDRTWHLNEFHYGCPSLDCQMVHIHNDLPKHD